MEWSVKVLVIHGSPAFTMECGRAVAIDIITFFPFMYKIIVSLYVQVHFVNTYL